MKVAKTTNPVKLAKAISEAMKNGPPPICLRIIGSGALSRAAQALALLAHVYGANVTFSIRPVNLETKCGPRAGIEIKIEKEGKNARNNQEFSHSHSEG